MTALVGVVVEAWAEVRVHRARVVLSLVGVFLAVFAMTIVTAAGGMGRQAILEANERSGGRATTLSVNAYSPDGAVDQEQVDAAYASVVERFGVRYSSTVVQSGVDLPLPQGVVYATVLVVEPAYGLLHRITPSAGRWLLPSDADRLSPALVVNEAFVEQVGLTGSAPPFAVELPGEPGVTATVVGVVSRDEWNPEVILLPAATGALPPGATAGASPQLELWVPPGSSDELAAAVPAVLATHGLQGDAYPSSDESILQVITWVQWGVRGLSLFALALGALGVLNVGIVTVRQRVREIGVRRALGASSARVFAAVLLESVCATALAGALGVAAAVAVVVNLPLDLVAGDLGISTVPPFPVSAAVEAFVAATAVGALVGLVPATMAVRARVIDAIRY